MDRLPLRLARVLKRKGRNCSTINDASNSTPNNAFDFSPGYDTSDESGDNSSDTED
jgi:hypothetical protein